jgi:hypothetical protein
MTLTRFELPDERFLLFGDLEARPEQARFDLYSRGDNDVVCSNITKPQAIELAKALIEWGTS